MTTLRSLLTAESVERGTVVVARAVQDGEPYEFEHDFVRPDGDPRLGTGFAVSRNEAPTARCSRSTGP